MDGSVRLLHGYISILKTDNIFRLGPTMNLEKCLFQQNKFNIQSFKKQIINLKMIF